MIDKITILNVQQRSDKLNWCRQALLDVGVPETMIETYPAKYWKDYDNLDNLVAFAVDDGFEFFGNVQYSEDFRHNQRNVGQLAQTWSYVSFYRDIQELNETHIFMHDDMCLLIDFETLIKACDQIPNKDELLFAYISNFISKPILREQIVHFQNPWIKSFNDGSEWDCVKIYTPRGASILLDKFQNSNWVGDGWFMGWIWSLHHEYFKNCGNIYQLALNPELSGSEMSKVYKKLVREAPENRFEYTVVAQHPSLTSDIL